MASRPSVGRPAPAWAYRAWGAAGTTVGRTGNLGLHLGRRRRSCDLDDGALEAFADGTGHPWAGDAVREGLVRARESFREIDRSIPARMREALSEHWSRVPLLRAMGGLPVPIR